LECLDPQEILSCHVKHNLRVKFTKEKMSYNLSYLKCACTLKQLSHGIGWQDLYLIYRKDFSIGLLHSVIVQLLFASPLPNKQIIVNYTYDKITSGICSTKLRECHLKRIVPNWKSAAGMR
jgi:hypothetical protein